MTDKLVFVLGCPRSGTSPFARWLHACGLETFGDERRHPRYPTGYFEHLPILMFHKALERLPRGGDHRITTEPFLKSEDLDDPFVAEVFRLAFRPVLERQVDFVKFPQLALSIDFLFEQFHDIHVIALWRDPAATFRSLVINELPNDMIPASGVKAVLLWNLYAHHLVAAKKSRPNATTLVNIDRFLATPTAGAEIMKRIGRPPSSAVPVEGAIDPGTWRTDVTLAWRVYHRTMAWLGAAAASRLGPEHSLLASESHWLRELDAVTDR